MQVPLIFQAALIVPLSQLVPSPGTCFLKFWELHCLCILLLLALNAKLTKFFLDKLRNLEVHKAFHSPQSLVTFSPRKQQDAVAARCQHCAECCGVNVLKLMFCVSSLGEIFIKKVSKYPALTREINSAFLLVSLGLQKVASIAKDIFWR